MPKTKTEVIKGVNLDNKADIFTAILKAQSGVLYIKGAPGIGKTAMFQQIAKKENWNLVEHPTRSDGRNRSGRYAENQRN